MWSRILIVFCVYAAEFFAFVSGSQDDHTGSIEHSTSGLIVSFVAIVALVSVVLLCAGDSKSVQVQHTDSGAVKQKGTPTSVVSSRDKRSAFKEVELSASYQNKNTVKSNSESVSKPRNIVQQQTENDSHIKNITKQETKTTSDLRKKDDVLVASTSHKLENNALDRQFSDVSLTSAQSRTDHRNKVDLTSVNRQNEASVSQQVLIPSNPVNNRQNEIGNERQAREKSVDDFGYHSDYSRSESKRQSTQRTSQPSSNPRSTATNYELDDDAIETYQDDGESIDWN